MSKNINLALVLLLFSKISESQKLKLDSLVNYSYMITGESLNGYSGSGTGFIVKYIDKYYLVTNYHVMTGKDPTTNLLMPNVVDSNAYVDIVFRSKVGPLLFHPMKYPLYSENGVRNFATYQYGDFLVDVAVICIDYSKEALNYSIPYEQIDTSLTVSTKSKVWIFGFPGSLFKNNWQPEKLISNLLRPYFPKPLPFNPYLYLDSSTYAGMSGSPAYYRNSNGSMRLLALAVSSRKEGYIDDFYIKNPKVQAMVVNIKFAAILIEYLYKLNAPPITGQFVQGK
jgi:Trypsin-like peptidase domain